MNKTKKMDTNKGVELICVYDADGSLLGELNYLFWKKAFQV